MRVIEQIETQAPAADALRVWFLGGNSLVVQSSTARVYVDPFLVTAAEHDGVFRRRKDPPVTAGEVRSLDAVLITHEHRDHCNVRTLDVLLRGRSTPCIAPKVSANMIQRSGAGGRIRTVVAGDSAEIAGLTVDVCESGDPVAENPVSYLVRYAGLSLYIAGDALSVPRLPAGAAGLNAAFLPIAKNPADRKYYPSAEEWMAMAAELSPVYAVPVHWDVWADYFFDPHELMPHACRALRIVPVGGYIEISHGAKPRSER